MDFLAKTLMSVPHFLVGINAARVQTVNVLILQAHSNVSVKMVLFQQVLTRVIQTEFKFHPDFTSVLKNMLVTIIAFDSHS